MLGANVRKVREEKGVTQKELAALVGVDVNTVWRWEQDRTDLSLSSLMKIAKALGVSASVLLEEDAPDEGSECDTEATNDHGADEMIVFEWSDGAGGKMRMVLPPTPESYEFLHRKTSGLPGGEQSSEAFRNTGGSAASA